MQSFFEGTTSAAERVMGVATNRPVASLSRSQYIYELFRLSLRPYPSSLLKPTTVGCPVSLGARFVDIASHRSHRPFRFVVGCE
jgi:hypothetical protein